MFSIIRLTTTNPRRKVGNVVTSLTTREQAAAYLAREAEAPDSDALVAEGEKYLIIQVEHSHARSGGSIVEVRRVAVPQYECVAVTL